jgi:two-component system, OmpR family, sensor histidine kinase SenX3
MTTLLVIAGALIVFAAGWALGRSGRRPTVHQDETKQREVPLVAVGEVAHGLSVAEVVDGHPTGVVVGDAAGHVQFRNRAAHQLEGTHAGVLLDAAIERHLALGRDGAASDEVIEFYGPPKQVFDVTARPLPGGGSVVFVDDISERRRIDQVRTDFVANISHELKTPIGALSVLAETLVGDTDPDTLGRIVNRMLAEADRASETIDDLMELSRIEAGGDQLIEPVRVSDIIRGGVDRVTELASRRRITISTLEPVDGAVHRSDGLRVLGDRRQLVSAVGNLIENAVKYSDPESSVQVRARQHDGWVEITVADQGAGIPQRDLDRIFERFYRVDRARSRSTGGTGLGLSIVRHVASNHRGEVLVTSTEGEGSTFVLRLPTGSHESARADGDSAPDHDPHDHGPHDNEPHDQGPHDHDPHNHDQGVA